MATGDKKTTHSPLVFGTVIGLHVAAVAAFIALQGCSMVQPRDGGRTYGSAYPSPSTHASAPTAQPVAQRNTSRGYNDRFLKPPRSTDPAMRQRVASRPNGTPTTSAYSQGLNYGSEDLLGKDLKDNTNNRTVVRKTPETSGPVPADSDFVTVAKGDSLSALARRHGVTVKDLKTWNRLNGDTIFIGQKLKLTGKGPAPKRPGKTNLAEFAGLGDPGTEKDGNESERGGARAGTPPSGPGGSYTVKAGDSLSVIAHKHGVKVADIMSLNKLTSDRIQIDQILAIPGKSDVPVTDPATGTEDPSVDETGVTVPVSNQNISTEDHSAEDGAPAVEDTGTDGATQADDEQPAGQTPVDLGGGDAADQFTYEVLSGDTLKTITETFLTTPEALKELNPSLKSDADLKPGMKIVIPPIK